MNASMNNLRGAALMVLAMAGFALEDSVIKTVTARVPMGQVLIFLGAVGGLGFSLLAVRATRCALSRGVFHPMVVLRNLCEMGGTAAFVYALTVIPLPLLAALLQAMPLFVTLGAIVFFGEHVGWRRWLAIVVGLVGVSIILWPGFDGFDPLALFGLLAALLLSLRDVVTRHVPPEIHPLQISAWGFLMVIPAGIGLLAIDGSAVRPTGPETALMLGAVVCGMGGYYALTRAMQTGEVGFVTPFRYARLLFALILGWTLFDERPDAPMLLGAAIVVAAGLYTLLHERNMLRASEDGL